MNALIRNSKGQSIIGVITGVGVTLVALLAMATFMNTTSNAQRTLQTKVELASRMDEVRLLLSDSVRCKSAFKDSGGSNVTVSAYSSPVPLNAVNDGTSDILKQDGALASGGKIEVLRLEHFAAPSGADPALVNVMRLHVEVKKSSSTMGDPYLKMDSPPFYLTTNAGAIQSCGVQSSSGSGCSFSGGITTNDPAMAGKCINDLFKPTFIFTTNTYDLQYKANINTPPICPDRYTYLSYTYVKSTWANQFQTSYSFGGAMNNAEYSQNMFKELDKACNNFCGGMKVVTGGFAQKNDPNNTVFTTRSVTNAFMSGPVALYPDAYKTGNFSACGPELTVGPDKWTTIYCECHN